MKSIAAKMVAVMIALGTSSAACASVNLHGEAGAEFTNLSASFGAGEPGMSFNTQWAHSDNDGDSVGLGMGYNFTLGPFLMTLGGKGVYLNPKDGDEGYAIAAGGGAELPLGQYFTLFGEGYYSPDSMSSGVEDYVEANAGVSKLAIAILIWQGKRAIATTPWQMALTPGLTSAFNASQGLPSGSPCLISAGQRHGLQHAVDLLQTSHIILFPINLIHGRHLLQTGQSAIYLIRLAMSVEHIARHHILQIMTFQRMVKTPDQCRIVLEIASHHLGIVRRNPRLTVRYRYGKRINGLYRLGWRC